MNSNEETSVKKAQKDSQFAMNYAEIIKDLKAFLKFRNNWQRFPAVAEHCPAIVPE